MSLLLAALLLVPQDADRLLRDLADDEVSVRDAAQAEVVKLGREKAAPILARAAAHRDPEVRARARAVRRAFDPPPLALYQSPNGQRLRWRIEAEAAVVEAAAAEQFIRLARLRTQLTTRRAPIPTPAIPTGPAPKAEDVRGWIRALGSDSFATREKASGELRKAGKHVQAQLKKAAASRDREVAFRARSLLSALQPRTVGSTDWEIYPHLGDMFGR